MEHSKRIDGTVLFLKISSSGNCSSVGCLKCVQFHKCTHGHPGEYDPEQQCVKKVLSDSLGLEDFVIRLVTLALTLPDGQVNLFENSNYRGTVYSNLLIKKLLWLVKVMFGLVQANHS